MVKLSDLLECLSSPGLKLEMFMDCQVISLVFGIVNLDHKLDDGPKTVQL